MLGVPNQGAEMADLLRENYAFRLVFGPAGQQLVTHEAGLIRSLPSPDFEFAIIAGGRGGAGLQSAHPGGQRSARICRKCAAPRRGRFDHDPLVPPSAPRQRGSDRRHGPLSRNGAAWIDGSRQPIPRAGPGTAGPLKKSGTNSSRAKQDIAAAARVLTALNPHENSSKMPTYFNALNVDLNALSSRPGRRLPREFLANADHCNLVGDRRSAPAPASVRNSGGLDGRGSGHLVLESRGFDLARYPRLEQLRRGGVIGRLLVADSLGLRLEAATEGVWLCPAGGGRLFYVLPLHGSHRRPGSSL